MKTIVCFLVTLTTLVTVKAQVNAQQNTSISQDWLTNAQKGIEASEYTFKRLKASSNLFFYAANRKQGTSCSINPLGYAITPLQLTGKPVIDGWKEQFMLQSITKNDNTSFEKGAFTIKEEAGKLSFAYNAFTIEYVNDAKGLRQNFIITNKPAGNNNLSVSIQLDGTLTPGIQNNELQFANENEVVKLYYRDLKVWDANNKMLDAKMELNKENVVTIVVNDKDAVYPVTIDPINQTPEWTGSADGILPTIIGQLAVDAAYGFSVAGVGDVNADGYDDVAIGAPAMVDIISGTGTLASVGAVFVYYGSPAGLSTTAGAVLQPTTCVAGALFGYSVAGGDVNNDGKSDIIVGAPLDNVSISIGGGSTASGTVGKVYVFSGATLTTNTTPLISLQLSGTGILENGVNLSVNALFGFSVAVTEDLNNDGKQDMIVGAPTYAGIKTGLFGNSLLDVQSGGAFVFLTNAANTNTTLVKLNPNKTTVLGLGLLAGNIDGLLFGYSVDGLGDYNNDGRPDVVASAPAGIDLSSLGAILNGKLLQGSAVVYYGNGSGVNTNPGATLTATSGGLLTNFSGTIANAANLFGISVKGVRSGTGIRNGNVLVGAPLGGVAVNVLSLQLKAGTVNVFKKKTSSPSGSVSPDQVLSSPRNSNSILSVIQCNLLFGYSLDNTLDINCDGYGDIIVGEPASSGVQLLNANVAGGAAYVYFGKYDGTYQTSPAWTFTAYEDAFLGVNATSMIGYSVAGAGRVKGFMSEPRILVGAPSRTLDFGAGLLNLGATLNTLFSLAAGDNGVGKAYEFKTNLCVSAGPLPVTLTQLKGVYANGTAHLTWSTMQETNSAYFEMERSKDGVNFTSVSKTTAAGNSSKQINYAADDAKVNNGANYYRLKMMDINGRFVYSNTVLLNVTIKGINITRIYPSPFVNKVNVEITSENSTEVKIRLMDNTGKTLVNRMSVVTKGNNNITLNDLDNLAKGIYLIEVHAGDTVITQKLMKQ